MGNRDQKSALGDVTAGDFARRFPPPPEPPVGGYQPISELATGNTTFSNVRQSTGLTPVTYSQTGSGAPGNPPSALRTPVATPAPTPTPVSTPATPSALGGTAYTYAPPEKTSASPGELDWLRNNGVQANRPAVTWGLRGTAEIDRRGGLDSASGWMENPANREQYGSPVASPSFLAPPAKTGHFLADTINTAMYSHQLASQNRVAMQLAAMRQAQLKNSQTADYQNRVAANSEAETAIKRQELETKAPEIAASAEERRARAAKETAWESTAGERNKNASVKERVEAHHKYYNSNLTSGMTAEEASNAADRTIAKLYGEESPKPSADYVYRNGQLITNTQ